MSDSEAIKIIEQTVRGFSHEFKNPLTTVKGYAQLLQIKKNDPAFIEKSLVTMLEQIEKIESNIDDFYLINNIDKELNKSINIDKVIDQIHENSVYKENVAFQKDGAEFPLVDLHIANKVINLLIDKVYWEYYDDMNIILDLNENEFSIHYSAVDFSSLKDKVFYIPYISKQIYKNGTELYAAKKFADCSNFAFDIDIANSKLLFRFRNV